ncbi:V-type proton ATPase subunit F [Cryptotermes secundus]|uniref:V-type proton ATPase subunit F n=1 Tax=Cryptotermes secundus TaxID=105785 RepID=A0A2J7PX93_9NEOP|nr:V-type proton ATPase subunit F [Cryptotermes secundus]
MALHSAIKGKLVSVIGDEDTCVGFLLGGVGEINKNRHPNFMVVDKNTSVSEIEECFKRFVKRDDIDIILINQNVAEMIRHCIDSHLQPVPSVLEIPSKDHPYDPTKDSILRRARKSTLHEKPLHCQKIDVWCAAIAFLEIDEHECWLQQDGATCHTFNETMQFLHEFFGDHVISKGLRFPRSPDLSPSDFFPLGVPQRNCL